MASSNTWWSWWWESTNENDKLAKSTLTIALLILAVAWFVRLTAKRSASGLPPGPRGLPLLGNLPFLDPDLHLHFANLAKAHGPIFKLWLGNKLSIVISSSALAKEVLKDHDVTFANRDVPVAARVISYGGSDIAWTPYGPEWRMLRKVCVREMLSGASLDSVYALRRREMRATVSHVYKNAGNPINVGEQMFLTTLNVITSMMWGGTMKGEERDRLGSEFRQLVNEITDLLGRPNVSDFFPGLARFDLQGIEKQMKEPLARFDRMFDVIIDQRLKKDKEEAEGKRSRKDSRDFLQLLLKLKDEGYSKTPLTMAHLKALLMDMIVGGTDTTSATVEWVFAELMQKPEILRQAQEELAAVVGEDKMVEESHVSKLHYLDAALKEALRLHPTLPLLVPHCPSEACSVGGYTIPKGARVFVNVWAIHRDPSTWPNPTEFDPGRFLKTEQKWDFSGNDFGYFPFGSGRRICAGLGMAQRMVMYALGSLIHSFDWRLAEGENGDVTEKFGIVMKKAAPLIAIPTPRLSNPELYAE